MDEEADPARTWNQGCKMVKMTGYRSHVKEEAGKQEWCVKIV